MRPAPSRELEQLADTVSPQTNDDDDDNQAKKEQYLFSGFGQKLQDHFRKFMKEREQRDQSPASSPTTTSDGQDRIKNEDKLLRVMRDALTIVPFWFIHTNLRCFRKSTERERVPILLSYLSLQVVSEGAGADRQLFAINLEYGRAFKWTVYRSAMDIIKLHYILQWRHVKGLLPAIPGLPSLRSADRINNVTVYLRNLLAALHGCFNVVDVCEFFELSHITLTTTKLSKDGALIEKPLEGYLKCAVKSDSPEITGPRHLLATLTPKRTVYTNLWVILKPSSLLLCHKPSDPNCLAVILADQTMKIGVENEYTGRSQSRFGRPFTITIFYERHGQRLKVRPEGRKAYMQHWLERLRQMAADSPWCQPHRFASYAPIRRLTGGDTVDWLIDAKQYYARAVRAIEAAKEVIFVHGWWVSPELHLLRPSTAHPDYRLDRLLKRKAEEGVMVYILVFKEITMSLSINSAHTKSKLKRLHPNIRILRHPDHYSIGVFFWAHHEKMLIIDHREAFIGGLDLCYGRFDSPEHHLSDQGLGVYTGLDYANPLVREYRQVTDPDSQVVDAMMTPRMPWHDVQVRLTGQVAGDLGRHFIQRWNYVLKEKGLLTMPLLVPFDDNLIDETDDNGSNVTVQAVRSAGQWSLGVATDCSIYDSLLAMISNAQQYVYIENQYLISNATDNQQADEDETALVKNRLFAALAQRIIQAHRHNQPFRVLIVAPLQPAFEAPLERPEATTCRLIMQSQYNSLSRAPWSLFQALKRHGVPSPCDYVQVVSLRKCGRLEGRLVTEQIYVHSKLMIVDDRIAFIGSANLNDRSLLGARDSEIGVVVEAAAEGDVVRELRVRLMAEHLGWDVRDERLHEFTTSLFDLVKEQAAQNTDAYRLLFHCLPDDTVTTWSEYTAAMSMPKSLETLTNEQFKALQSIRGHVVKFPLQYLSKEDLTASLLSKEFLLPMEVYL